MDMEMTPEEIQACYVACTHSVDLINGIYDGTAMVGETQAEKDDCLQRNKDHLQIMIDKGHFSDAEDATLQAAIDRTS
jgi:hypothetical protein